MGIRYDFKKQDVRNEASDLRMALRAIEYAMRTNDYSYWKELQLDVVAIAIQLANKMKGQ